MPPREYHVKIVAHDPDSIIKLEPCEEEWLKRFIKWWAHYRILGDVYCGHLLKVFTDWCEDQGFRFEIEYYPHPIEAMHMKVHSGGTFWSFDGPTLLHVMRKAVKALKVPDTPWKEAEPHVHEEM